MAQNRPASKPTAAQVRAQCDRILSSKLFALSNRMRAFLKFVVDAQLENRADRLKEFTLGVEVFDKDASFDPGIDSIVRVEASRLRSKLREYYEGEGQGDPIQIEIPKGHYVPVFQSISRVSGTGHPAQALEPGRSKLVDLGSRQTFQLAVISLLLGAVIYLVVGMLIDEEPAPVAVEPINDKSVAVLPFVPLSAGQDDEYFADGLSEEILNSLAQLPELHVTARTSSFYFKGQNLLIPEIAGHLGVAHVVEGSVRRDGDRV